MDRFKMQEEFYGISILGIALGLYAVSMLSGFTRSTPKELLVRSADSQVVYASSF